MGLNIKKYVKKRPGELPYILQETDFDTDNIYVSDLPRTSQDNFDRIPSINGPMAALPMQVGPRKTSYTWGEMGPLYVG